MALAMENGEIALQNGDVDEQEEMAISGDVDPMSSLEDPAKPIRLIRKAKRTQRTNSGGDATQNNAQTERLPVAKNSRKSRDGRGRGDPKKGEILF
jgi:hypothetical protein